MTDAAHHIAGISAAVEKQRIESEMRLELARLAVDAEKARLLANILTTNPDVLVDVTGRERVDLLFALLSPSRTSSALQPIPDQVPAMVKVEQNVDDSPDVIPPMKRRRMTSG